MVKSSDQQLLINTFFFVVVPARYGSSQRQSDHFLLLDKILIVLIPVQDSHTGELVMQLMELGI